MVLSPASSCEAACRTGKDAAPLWAVSRTDVESFIPFNQTISKGNTEALSSSFPPLRSCLLRLYMKGKQMILW